MTDLYVWVKGAAWLFPDGRLEIVTGFHDEWLEANQDRAAGCKNVADVVTKLGWVSVVAYSKGYVEFMIRSRKDADSVRLCVEHLKRNMEAWVNALVMTMDEEGYIMLTKKDFATENHAEQKIMRI